MENEKKIIEELKNYHDVIDDLEYYYIEILDNQNISGLTLKELKKVFVSLRFYILDDLLYLKCEKNK